MGKRGDEIRKLQEMNASDFEREIKRKLATFHAALMTASTLSVKEIEALERKYEVKLRAEQREGHR